MITWNTFNAPGLSPLYYSGLLGEYRYLIQWREGQYDLNRRNEYEDDWKLVATFATLKEAQAKACQYVITQPPIV